MHGQQNVKKYQRMSTKSSCDSDQKVLVPVF